MGHNATHVAGDSDQAGLKARAQNTFLCFLGPISNQPDQLQRVARISIFFACSKF